MLKKIDFGRNGIKKCVEIDGEEAWRSYVQFNKDAKGWRDKPFPLYDRLVNVFGKDRATEKQTESPVEMVEEIDKNDNEVDPLDLDDPSSPIAVQNERQVVGRKRSRENTSISLPQLSTIFKDIMEVWKN